MKKFMAVCGILLGGLALAGAMVLFVGCAQFQARTYGMEIRGRTMAPENVLLAHAEADAVTAQAYAVRRCSDNEKHCGPVWGWGGWGGGLNGELDTPAGVTWSGMAAAAGYNRAMGAGSAELDSRLRGNDRQKGMSTSGGAAKDVELLKRSVAAVAKHQAALGRAVSVLAEGKPEPMQKKKNKKKPPKKPAAGGK